MVEKTFPAEDLCSSILQAGRLRQKALSKMRRMVLDSKRSSRKPAANPAQTSADTTLSSTTQQQEKLQPSRNARGVSHLLSRKNGHTRIKPYPVVARWRKDIYLTHASIIDFQPYVTEGIAPPPANPLVISQPSIRLTDISNTGPTFGRHLTIFEMGGAHAFNYPDKEVYWKDETVRFHHRFATEALGIKSEEVIYKEGVWIGGGNAGPDVECICPRLRSWHFGFYAVQGCRRRLRAVAHSHS